MWHKLIVPIHTPCPSCLTGAETFPVDALHADVEWGQSLETYFFFCFAFVFEWAASILTCLCPRGRHCPFRLTSCPVCLLLWSFWRRNGHLILNIVQGHLLYKHLTSLQRWSTAESTCAHVYQMCREKFERMMRNFPKSKPQGFPQWRLEPEMLKTALV